MGQPRIFVDEDIPLLAESLAACAEVQRFSGRRLKSADLVSCDALCVRAVTRVDNLLLEGSSLRFVGSATSGSDHVDRDYLKHRGIAFADARGCNANAVAEYVVYAMLAWAERRQTTLHGRAIGIIGLGHIGRRLAAYAHGLGMTVLVHDPPLLESGYELPAAYRHMSLIDLCAAAQVVSTHVPFVVGGAHPTVRLLGAEEFEALPERSLLVHTSRGGVICESDLMMMLVNKEIDLAFDVWENEPFANPLLARLAFPATPHIAGYSLDGKVRGARMIGQAVAEAMDLQPDFGIFELPVNDASYSAGHLPQEAELCRILTESRHLDQDTRDFRSTMFATDAERADSFDRQRRNYTLRRESLTIESQ